MNGDCIRGRDTGEISEPRSIQHARDYTSGLHDYTIRAERIAPAIAQSEAEGVTRNLQATQQNLAVVRETAPDDQAVRDSIGKVEQHLKKAAELHQTLHEQCHRQEIDREATAECCNDLIKELDLAIAEHGALMRSLNARHGTKSRRRADNTVWVRLRGQESIAASGPTGALHN